MKKKKAFCGDNPETEKETGARIANEQLPVWYDGRNLYETTFCHEYLAEHPMICVNGSFFTTEGRITDEARIGKEMYDMLKPYVSTGAAKRVKNLLDTLRLEAFSPDLPVQTDRLHLANGTLFLKPESSCVGGANGTLFLDGMRFTTDKEFCRNRLPVAYNPGADLPVKWMRFIEELLEDEDAMTLQEFMGYCLIPTTRGQTMLLLKGSGGEGKSRIGIVMRALLGENLKNGSIAKVEHSPFARADLEHELCMVDDDMQMEALKSTHYLKSLITAEMPMDLEKKGEQSYQGEMYVRFLAFSNGDLQALYDHSEGFFRRQLILSVKKKPKDRKDDPFLADKLCAEAEGIFLWCLAGLKRLMGNGFRFTESEHTKANREEARQDADNVIPFLRSEGYIRLKADSTIPSAELYAIYRQWCADNAVTPLYARTFTTTLIKHAAEFRLEHDNHIMNKKGKRVNGFWGIEGLISPTI